MFEILDNFMDHKKFVRVLSKDVTHVRDVTLGIFLRVPQKKPYCK